MRRINIRSTKNKSKIGNYSEVRKQISQKQADIAVSKSQIRGINTNINAASNITMPIEDFTEDESSN